MKAGIKKQEVEFIVTDEYREWIALIKDRIKNSQIKASIKVNRELLELYWHIDEDIVNRQKHSKWGDGLLRQMSIDLKKSFPDMTGFSETNLKTMRLSSLDKGKQKTNNIIGCQPYTKHRFQQNRSGVFVCVLDIVTRSAPARFHRSVHGVSAGFIPRRRATHSTAGAACQGQSRRCAAVLRTLDWQSRLCYLPRRDGGYILQSRPLSLDRERAGG